MSHRRIVSSTVQLDEAVEGERLMLDAEASHHLEKVLRLEVGQELEICDGRGLQWWARVQELQPQGVCLELLRALAPCSELFPVFLAQAMPKADRFEHILQKGTELGVAGFFPFFSSRTVVKLDAKRQAKKLPRWEKILQQAARQCQRSIVPFLEPPTSLAGLLPRLPEELPCLVCWEGETHKGLDDWIREHPEAPGVVAVVGPEGGFSSHEIDGLQAAGIDPVSLGPLILRTETAGPTVASILQFAYGHLGKAPKASE